MKLVHFNDILQSAQTSFRVMLLNNQAKRNVRKPHQATVRFPSRMVNVQRKLINQCTGSDQRHTGTALWLGVVSSHFFWPDCWGAWLGNWSVLTAGCRWNVPTCISMFDALTLESGWVGLISAQGLIKDTWVRLMIKIHKSQNFQSGWDNSLYRWAVCK
jgi:hypothetical protein